MSKYTLNRPTTLTCPECGGALRQSKCGPLLKYTCHIGHVLTAEAMLVAQADRIEFLATAFLAILNERRELCRQMIEVGQDDSGVVQQAEQTARQNSEAMQKFLNATSLT
jgi:two-component system, chemotaxis family, protein-glutamate methylesterase/glutaminase